ncbi:hypothetical protein ONZ45_g17353 [Pleurotus djamor]|nr:hypothetical protein ONZ45_g17353 [Pleurotus djamor]
MMVKGRYLPYSQYLRHQQSVLQSGIAQDDDDAGSEGVSVAPTPEPTYLEYERPRHKRRRDDKNIDEYLQQLRNFQRRLGSILVAEFPVDVIFKQTGPPKPERFELDPLVSQNQSIIAHESWIAGLRPFLEQYPLRQQSHHVNALSIVLLRTTDRVQKEIEAWKCLQWSRQHEIPQVHQPDTPHILHTDKVQSAPPFSPILMVTFLLVAAMRLLGNFSLSNVGDILKGVGAILQCATAGPHSFELKYLASKLPQDPRTILKWMPCLSPPHHSYACCTDCYSIYPYDAKTQVRIPTNCTHRASRDAGECGQPLRKRDTQSYNPRSTFLYQDLKHWIAWMFCRPDIASALDKFPLTDDALHADSPMEDIWDGSILREFQGPPQLGEGRFMVKLPNERRLIFSLNFDSLNPNGTRPAGRVAKVGGLYMACLNLPRSIRFHVENVFFAGVVPGPESPSTSQINHLLSPLVDTLLDLWDDGLFLTKTPLHPHGLLVRCALVPVVCDLPAAHQICGAPSHNSSDPCIECKIKQRGLEDFDFWAWDVHDGSRVKELGRQWKDAATQTAQDSHFAEHHRRWSELFRLPYWDPCQHVVVDSMHCLYLGLFQNHCRKVWGMDDSLCDGDGITFDPLSKPPTREKMSLARYLLRAGSRTALEKCGLNALSQLCREVGLRYNPLLTVAYLSNSLLEFRISQGWFDDDGQCLISPQELAQEMYYEGSKEVIRQHMKLNVAREICRDILKLPSERYAKMTKPEIVGFIQLQRQINGIIDAKEDLKEDDPRDEALKGRKTSVLGKQTLAEIRRDMSFLLLPSCVGTGPRQPGEKKGGSLKADEWRTFCTINLPITLTRLWTAPHATEREQKMLKNFLHLVQAVRIASFREISISDVQAYRYHMYTYLTTLILLYPGTRIVPNQHMALHLGDHLSRWGPVHSWRCFAFERFNGMLQHITTNSKFGELEGTLFRHFTQGQRLRALFKSLSPDPIIGNLLKKLVVQHDADIRTTFMEDMAGFDNSTARPTIRSNKPVRLPSPLYDALKLLILRYDCDMGNGVIPWDVKLVRRIQRRDEVFKPLYVSERDSYIIFDAGTTRQAGQIRNIFFHHRVRNDGTSVCDTFLLVAPFSPLEKAEDISVDVFRRFPAAGILFHRHFSPDIIIHSRDIAWHAAVTDLEVTGEARYVHVLPLVR